MPKWFRKDEHPDGILRRIEELQQEVDDLNLCLAVWQNFITAKGLQAEFDAFVAAEARRTVAAYQAAER